MDERDKRHRAARDNQIRLDRRSSTVRLVQTVESRVSRQRPSCKTVSGASLCSGSCLQSNKGRDSLVLFPQGLRNALS